MGLGQQWVLINGGAGRVRGAVATGKSRTASALGSLLATVVLATTVMAPSLRADPPNTDFPDSTFVALCNVRALQSVADAAGLSLTVAEVENLAPGQVLPEGARYFPPRDGLPGYCQVSGRFVTHPASGRTANFLATLPQDWNGKYLQYGCFSHCGFFLFNDASHPRVDLVAQGKPGDSLRKGYASFSTDQGHTSRELADWAVTESGEPDREALDDFYYRANRELAAVAKTLTSAVYSRLAGEPRAIARSYFTGCSGGGRDGLVAASHFPEAFDGIIVGSPYANMVSVNVHRVAQEMALRRPGAVITPALEELLNDTILAGCDAVDGVADGIIQNPAVCDFDPARDLPRCGLGSAPDTCFSERQIDAVSTLLSAVTDLQGRVVQPGMSVSELKMMVPESGKPLDNPVLRYFAFGNPENSPLDDLVYLSDGGEGSGLRGMVDGNLMAEANRAVTMGTGDIAGKMVDFIRQDRKMLIWHNLSDERLTPYISFNYYNRLAGLHGGHEQLQENVRLFSLPGTGHCGMSGVGPTSFDALGAMEAWVEQGKAPNGLVAARYPDGDFSGVPDRTMPLCTYPQMARYRGQGDVNDAASWHCPEGDRTMLEIGPSGQRAGVVRD